MSLITKDITVSTAHVHSTHLEPSSSISHHCKGMQFREVIALSDKPRLLHVAVMQQFIHVMYS